MYPQCTQSLLARGYKRVHYGYKRVHSMGTNGYKNTHEHQLRGYKWVHCRQGGLDHLIYAGFGLRLWFAVVFLCGVLQTIINLRNKAADRKSTRLNSSHQIISYAVFCLKKKKTRTNHAV